MPSPFRVHVAYLHFGKKKTLIRVVRCIDDVGGNGTRPHREPERVECDPWSDALHQDGGGPPRSAHRVRARDQVRVAVCEGAGPWLRRGGGEHEGLETAGAEKAAGGRGGQLFLRLPEDALPNQRLPGPAGAAG